MIEGIWLLLFVGFVVVPLSSCIWERRRGVLRVAAALLAAVALYAGAFLAAPAALTHAVGLPEAWTLFAALTVTSVALILVPCRRAERATSRSRGRGAS